MHRYALQRDVLSCYLELVRLRASGALATAATWMRGFLTAHRDYKGDSVLSDAMHNELVEACLGISDGSLVPPELLGRLNRRMELILSRLQEQEPPGAPGAGGEHRGRAMEGDS
eukprot:SAG11_NODE_12829_length_683_cov_0.945205_1_plen_113_part_10